MHQQQIFAALRNKNKLLAIKAAFYIYYSKGKKERKQRISQAGNLVIVRNHAIDKDKGKKLEPK